MKESVQVASLLQTLATQHASISQNVSDLDENLCCFFNIAHLRSQRQRPDFISPTTKHATAELHTFEIWQFTSPGREIALIFASILKLLRVLVRDVNVFHGITAAAYILFKCSNTIMVRNISSPLLTGAAAKLKIALLVHFFFSSVGTVCVSLTLPGFKSRLWWGNTWVTRKISTQISACDTN